MELARGIRAKDVSAVERRLDIDAASQQVIGSVVEAATAATLRDESQDGDNAFGRVGTAIGVSLAERMKPALAAQLASAFRTTLENHTAGTVPPSNIPDQLGPLFATMSSEAHGDSARPVMFLGFGERDDHADTAIIPLRLRSRELDTTLTVRALLVRRNHGWTVVGLGRLTETLLLIQSLERNRVEAYNLSVTRRMDSLVSLSPIRSRIDQIGDYSEYIIASVGITNRGSDTITDIYVRATGYKFAGDGLGFVLDKGATIAPGETRFAVFESRYNEYMDGHEMLRFNPAAFSPRTILLTTQRTGRPVVVSEVGSYAELQDRLRTIRH